MHKILILANIVSIKDFCKSCCLKWTKVRSLGNIYCFLWCDFCNTSFLPETITSSWGCSLCGQAIHYMLLKLLHSLHQESLWLFPCISYTEVTLTLHKSYTYILSDKRDGHEVQLLGFVYLQGTWDISTPCHKSQSSSQFWVQDSAVSTLWPVEHWCLAASSEGLLWDQETQD